MRTSLAARSATGSSRARLDPDAVAAAAIEIARAAAEDVGEPAHVGEHVGMEVEGDRIVTHLFDCLDPAYQGWRIAVTVVRAARAKHVTVSETVLLPGPEALLAPPWVPWSERLRPGDLGVGDLLPSSPDDERLVPGFLTVDDEELDPALVVELGVGRSRVLSPYGRDETARRWYQGSRGPDTPLARSAPGQCSTCGFFLSLAGSMRQVFGVCANEFAPDDGNVVSADHGCGAHSETAVPAPAAEPAPPVVDEIGYDVVDRPDR